MNRVIREARPSDMGDIIYLASGDERLAYQRQKYLCQILRCFANSIASFPVRCSMSKRIISIRERPLSISFFRLSSSFGGGMGRLREVCGTCSAMFMVAGILYGEGTETDHSVKTEHYKRIQYLAEEFRKQHETIVCRDLLKGLAVTSEPTPEKRTEQYYKVRPCVKFVRTAAEILDRYLEENPPVR